MNGAPDAPCDPHPGCRRAALPAAAHAATPQRWTLDAPGGALEATVAARGGKLTLTARRAGRFVVRARLGPATGRVEAVRRDRRSETFRTPAGKRRVHRIDARRLRLAFPRRSLELLVAADGVAVRARGAHRGTVRWASAAGSRSWLQRLRSNYEARYREGLLREARRRPYAYPALVRTPAGDAALLTESGLPRGAAAGHLQGARGLRVALPSGERETARTSWRLAVIGSLATVVGSDLPLALGARSRIADTSWIRPGRAAWSWWADSWSPRRLQDQRDHVDGAAAAGWEYVLVDEGWDAAWVPELVEYAAARGVRVLLWSDWRDLATPAARASVLDRMAAWGVAGVKLDFLESDRPARMGFMAAAARAAARRRLIVSFHGVTVPRGLERTWPNVLTYEGVLGAEHAKSGAPIAPAHDVDLVFTRNAIGPMDYTPAALSARGQRSTVAHRLAQAIAFESGLQSYADAPAGYAMHPEALELLAATPAAWDDTRLLAGEPGRFATLARRTGRAWFVGGLSATAARTERVRLGFLGEGAYTATVTTDDGAGGLTSTTRPVTARDSLEVPVASDGGFTVRLVEG